MAKKKWSVNAVVSGGKWLGVFEAETKEEAEQMAWDSGECHAHLCHQCAGECDDAQITELIIDEET